MSSVSVSNLVKDFGSSTHVLRDLSLTIEDGSFTVLLGPSGCGKSTLLRIIAGLDSPTSGQVLIDGADVTHVEPCDRNLAMVFQNYALYPHMTAFQNVEYGLKIRKVPKEERRRVVNEALELVGLADQANKRPAQMSGGQRQRVALARAIVKRPGVYLMDEPLSNLDAKLRGQMRENIVRLHRELGATFIYVTHDQVEAMSMGTKIVLLHNGVVEQQGSPQEIYQEPQTAYVAGFVGAPPTNLLAVKGGTLAIRPEHVELEEPASPSIRLEAKLLSREQLGDSTVHDFETRYGEVRVKSSCIWSDEKPYDAVYLPLSKIMSFGADGVRAAWDTSRIIDTLA